MKIEDELLGKVGFLDKLISKIQIYMLYEVDVLDFSTNLTLYNEICRKNPKIAVVPEFGIFDYITGNVSKQLKVIKKIMRHYRDQAEKVAAAQKRGEVPH